MRRAHEVFGDGDMGVVGPGRCPLHHGMCEQVHPTSPLFGRRETRLPAPFRAGGDRRILSCHEGVSCHNDVLVRAQSLSLALAGHEPPGIPVEGVAKMTYQRDWKRTAAKMDVYTPVITLFVVFSLV